MDVKKLFATLIFLTLLLSQAGSAWAAAAAGDRCCNDADCGTLKCFCEPSADCKREEKPANSGNWVITKGTGGICQEAGRTVFCPLSTHQDIADLVDEIVKWVFYLALIVAPLMIVLGAFVFMTSAGDTNKTTLGKNIIKWSAIGLAIVLFARGIFSVVRSILGV